MTASLIPDTIPRLIAAALFGPGRMRATALSSSSLVIFEPGADPVGAHCVVLARDGVEIRLIENEPVPGFYQSSTGSLHPRQAVRGIARVIIKAQGEEQ